MAAIMVKKSRPAGELVSIASWSETKSAPAVREQIGELQELASVTGQTGKL